MKKITLWLVLFFSVLTLSAQHVHKVQLNPVDSAEPAVIDLQTLATAAETENSFSFSYYGKKQKPYWYGIGMGDICDMHAAIFIPEEVAKNFIGRKLTTIKFGMKTLTSTSNYSVWVSEDLEGEPLYRQDCDVPVNPRRLFPVDLKTPYVINGKGFYIGYSMHVGECINPDHYYPIGVDLNMEHIYGNYMMINDEGWVDYGMEGGLGTLMIEGVCDGNILLNNVSMEKAGENTCVKGEEFLMPVTFYNIGKDDVKSISVKYSIADGEAKTSTVELKRPVAFMNSEIVNIPLVAEGHVALNQVNIEVTQVNGQPDTDTQNNKCNGEVIIISKKVQHKAVIEEITGTWCPYCPRGQYAMELISEQFPDDVIRIAGHFQDTFMVKQYYPYLERYIGRAPKCELGRNGIIDPYYGSTYMKDPNSFGTPFGIADDIRAELKRSSEAEIKLNVQRQGSWLTFTTNVTFFTNLDECDYKLAYFVLEDGLVAEQLNNYNVEPAYPTLEHLKELPYVIKDQVHNDVVRAVYSPLGMEGSLTGAIEEGKTKTHVYGVQAIDSIDNINKARAVVLLLNKAGRIVNGAEVSLANIETGIESTKSVAAAPAIQVANGAIRVNGEGALKAEVYSLDGKKVAEQKFNNETVLSLHEQKGVYLVRVNNNENVWVKKVIL